MEANRELEVLVEAIILHVFSPRGSSSIDTKSILRAHKKLRPRLWLLWFLGHARNYPIVWSLIWQVPPPAIIKIDG
jgi:hypothetical protein